MEVILSIAGSDSSAGAGIQQDLKTISALGCYGATAITAITSQNTIGVQGVMAVPAEVVKSQIHSVMTDLNVSAVKIGMIPNIEIAKVIVKSLTSFNGFIICDPVMISTSGTQLMNDDCVEYVIDNLFPLCTLITPNIPESERINNRYSTAYLIKGGHADGEEMTDTLYLTDGSSHTYSEKRIATKNLHGTGCTLSSSIACYMAKGNSLPMAVANAKSFITKAILRATNIQIGHGNGPLLCFDNN